MRALPALAMALALAAGTSQARRPDVRARVYTSPSDIVAVELAFNRLAREKGQWTAFRETAADDAVMFVPEKVLAKDWLKKRADPPAPVQWQPRRVYVSCNGRTAASTGAWQRPDGSRGYFTTIWQLNDKGEWKWALDHGDSLAKPLAETEALRGYTATCRKADRSGSGVPQDSSLLWTYDVREDGSRLLRVETWNGSAYDIVIDDKVMAP